MLQNLEGNRKETGNWIQASPNNAEYALKTVKTTHGCTTTNREHCWESNNVPTKVSGYIQFSFNGCNKLGTLHRLAYLARQDRNAVVPLVGTIKLGGQDMDVSHRCANTKCMNPDHMCLENKEANNRRKNCLVWIECHHPNCDRSEGFIFVCTHQPRCIKIHPTKTQAQIQINRCQ
jgi:hypothetical protein